MVYRYSMKNLNSVVVSKIDSMFDEGKTGSIVLMIINRALVTGMGAVASLLALLALPATFMVACRNWAGLNKIERIDHIYDVLVLALIVALFGPTTIYNIKVLKYILSKRRKR